MDMAGLTLAGREPYLAAASTLIAESGCTIRRYRTSTSGVAYCASLDWGIEVPEPRGPVSYATFAHEVGHQMLHRGTHTPRWQEEVEAWDYALATFTRFALPGYEKARLDAVRCIKYAYAKSSRRIRTMERLDAFTARFDALAPEWFRT